MELKANDVLFIRKLDELIGFDYMLIDEKKLYISLKLTNNKKK